MFNRLFSGMLEGTFNKEDQEALLGSFSGHCEASRKFVYSSNLNLNLNIASASPRSVDCEHGDGAGLVHCVGGGGGVAGVAGAELGAAERHGGRAAVPRPAQTPQLAQRSRRASRAQGGDADVKNAECVLLNI